MVHGLASGQVLIEASLIAFQSIPASYDAAPVCTFIQLTSRSSNHPEAPIDAIREPANSSQRAIAVMTTPAIIKSVPIQ